ncbi:MAG: hypothetical protein KDE27_30620 [Planctomycetes bacterium]|nr:hypothetical protein [Planctomycetota bacterium]
MNLASHPASRQTLRSKSASRLQPSARQLGAILGWAVSSGLLLTAGAPLLHAFSLATLWIAASFLGARYALWISVLRRAPSLDRRRSWKAGFAVGSTTTLTAACLLGPPPSLLDQAAALSGGVPVLYGFAKAGCCRWGCCDWGLSRRRAPRIRLPVLEAAASAVLATGLIGAEISGAPAAPCVLAFLLGFGAIRLLSLLGQTSTRIDWRTQLGHDSTWMLAAGAVAAVTWSRAPVW